MTNLEKIRSMSVEELSRWLAIQSSCEACEAVGHCEDGAVCKCKDVFKLWLNEEVGMENKESVRPIIKSFPDTFIRGAKRCNLHYSDWLDDWFVGSGKDESCQLEGTWWDMICLARNILASENTKITAAEYYHPEWGNDNYIGEEIPYDYA